MINCITQPFYIRRCHDLYNERPKPASNYQRIIRVVCDAYGITEKAIARQSRKRSVAEPRQVAMYLILLYEPKMTKKSIGELFNRSHATVIHAHQTVFDQLTYDQRFKQRYLKIQGELMPMERASG